ncbi:DUF427 domain-containing protein [Pseudomonas sp. PS24]|uniref:DUF427 domain-containing protein n=1 Tax=Pseudomonas akapageensis TaxID=2609961 RepID=UPI00140BA884
MRIERSASTAHQTPCPYKGDAYYFSWSAATPATARGSTDQPIVDTPESNPDDQHLKRATRPSRQ